MKRLSLIALAWLISVSVVGQVSQTFTIVYDPTLMTSIDYELAEGYPITWDHFDNVRHLTGDIVETVYWEATRDDVCTQVDGVWTRTIDRRQYNNLSEFDNKPYVQLKVDAYGGYTFNMYNSQTNERIGTGYFDFFPETSDKNIELVISDPFMIVEKMPALGPCKSMRGDERHQCTHMEIIKHVSKNTKYPPSAKDEGIQGTVFVYFVVGKYGNVKDVKILRQVDPRLDKEAKRVVESLPKFDPGQQTGRNVSVQYTIPVKFIIR